MKKKLKTWNVFYDLKGISDEWIKWGMQHVVENKQDFVEEAWV